MYTRRQWVKALVSAGLTVPLTGRLAFGTLQATSPHAVGELYCEGQIPRRRGGPSVLLTDKVFGSEYRASLYVDVAQERGRSIPPGIGGVNLEAQFNGFHTVTGDGQLQQSVVDCLRQLPLASKSLRWPGGGYDQLSYVDCLGPVQQRAPQRFFGGDPQVCAFGPREVSKLAQTLEAELWLQIQPMLITAGQRGPDAIMHGQEPVRQQNSGQADTVDFHVLNWQIGNEQYHYPADTYSVGEFIAAVQSLVPAMRTEDPDIRVWVPVQENYSHNLFSAQRDWTPRVLARLGHQIYGVTIHNGYAPVVPSAKSSAEVADAYRAMFSNSRWAAENLATIDKLVEQHAPEHAESIRFAVTEANACFGILPFEHNMMNHSQTLASAVYMASMLATYARHPRVDYVHLFTGVQFTSQGLIGVTDGEFATVPDTFSSVGLLLHLWNQWARGKLLTQLDIRAGTFASPDAGWMAGRDDNPLLDVLVRVDGNELGILLINRSLTDSARVTLNLDHYVISTLTAHGLLGQAPDSNPGLTIPKIVQPQPAAVLERFDQGGAGEVWIRTERLSQLSTLPTIHVPRSSVVFLVGNP